MLKYIIPFTLLFFVSLSVFGQIPREIVVKHDLAPTRGNTTSRAVLNDAGTITFGTHTGDSNDATTLDQQIFLCFGDAFTIIHNGDQDLSGDPDPSPSSEAGIGYAFYTDRPTVDGPTLTDILSDPNIIISPTNPESPFIYVENRDNGNATFQNTVFDFQGATTTLQDLFNSGEPIELWFAPITYDSLDSDFLAVYEGDPAGPCVDVNTDAAFSVVYLNQIESTVTSNECGGEILVTGGFAEFQGGNYTITIQNSEDPTIQGTITGTPRHNEPVTFSVPEMGAYVITISDGKDCTTEEVSVSIACPESMDFTISSTCPNQDIFVGEELCVDLDVTNFNALAGLQFSVEFDTSILEFRENIIDPAIADAIGLNTSNINVRDDILTISWTTTDFANGTSLADNTTFFQMCFEAVGEGNPNIRIGDPNTNPNARETEVFDVNNNILGFSDEICRTIEIVAAPPPNSLQIRPEIVKPCIGENNGSLSLSIAGGTPPFTVDLTGRAEDETGNRINDLPVITVFGRDTVIENLAADIYDYLIRDANNEANATSAFEGPIAIDETDLVVNIVDTQPRCFGEASGSLTAIPLENTQIVNDLEGYTFEWSNDSTGQTIDGLAPGPYSVVVTNPNGCTGPPGNINLGNPQQLRILNIVPTDATCSGTFDGSLNASADGGTAPLTYRWAIDTTLNNRMITGLDVGEYQLVVTDANGCSVGATQTVNSSSIISITPQIDSITCFGFDDATIVASRGEITGFPAETDFIFEWSSDQIPDLQVTGMPNDVSNQIDNVAPGTYTVRLSAESATDPSLSACFTTETFVITEPDSLVIDAIIEPTTNCRNPDGSIELAVSGGNGGITYAWTFRDSTISNPGNVNLVGSLPPDTVTVVVTDRNGCEQTLDTIISSPMPPVVNEFQNIDLDCATFTDGFLQVIASQGAAPITGYAWSHNGSITGNFAGNLSPGTYQVTITDENECSTIDSAMVTAPPPIQIANIDTLQEPCFGEANGSIQIEIMGGSGTYDYEWRDENNDVISSNNPTLTDVLAGTYTILGEDSNGCDFPQNAIVLPSLPEIVVDFPMDQIQGTSCFDNGLNLRDGAATAVVTYADGSIGQFDFIWPTQQDVGVAQSMATGLGSGMIEVLVFETNGICSTRAVVEIPSPPALELDMDNSTTNNITCNGGDDGSINVAAMGGTAPYTYRWDFQNSTDTNLNNLEQGTYTVTFTDANNCLAEQSFDITEPEPFVLLLDFDDNNTRDVVCSGQDDGQITILASGSNTAQGAVSYDWSPNVSTNEVAADLAPGTYNVTVTDALGCQDSIDYTISQPPPIQYNIGPNMDIQCNGGVTTIVADPLSFSGGNGGDYLFSVNNSPAQTLDRVIQVQAGDHFIRVFDSAGCAYDSTITVSEPPPITIEFPDAERERDNFFTSEVELGGEIELNPAIFSPLPIADGGLVWFSSNASDSSLFCNDINFCDQPIVRPLDNTTYTLSIVDQNGCTAEASIEIEVDRNRNVFIPNAFAPNASGFDLNETFRIYSGVGVQNIEYARVFDRWGALVANIENTLPNTSGVEVWDGMIDGQRAQQGVYVYIISVTFIDNTTLLYRGDVTVLR